MSLLEQDSNKKKQVNKNVIKLDVGNNKNKEYKVKVICNNATYRKESKLDHLLEAYYFMSWNNYPEEKKISVRYLAVQYLKKLINLFY